MLKKLNWEASVTVVSEGWRCWRYQWRWGRGQSPGGSAEQPPGERLWEEPQTMLLPSFARSMRAEKFNFWYIVGPSELKGWYTSYFLVIVSHMTTETFKRGTILPKAVFKQCCYFCLLPSLISSCSFHSHKQTSKHKHNRNTAYTHHSSSLQAT